MVKNPFKKNKKNPFEASMPLDKSEVKMVEARYKEDPFLVAFGVAKKRDVKGAGQVGTEGVKGKYESEKDLDWRVWYNPNALPKGFMPEEKLKDWMAGTVAVTSGSIAVYNPETQYIETEKQGLKEVKGRDPMEAFYDAGIIERPTKKKKSSKLE
jgi:hypothetical protein